MDWHDPQVWIGIGTLVLAVATFFAALSSYRLARIAELEFRIQRLPLVEVEWRTVSYTDGNLRVRVFIRNVSESWIVLDQIERRSNWIPSSGRAPRLTRSDVFHALRPGEVYPKESDWRTRFRFTVFAQPGHFGYVHMEVRIAMHLFGAPDAKRTFFNSADVHFKGDGPKDAYSADDFRIHVHQVLAPEHWYEESWRNRDYIRWQFHLARSRWDRWGQGFHDWMRDFGQGS